MKNFYKLQIDEIIYTDIKSNDYKRYEEDIKQHKYMTHENRFKAILNLSNDVLCCKKQTI